MPWLITFQWTVKPGMSEIVENAVTTKDPLLWLLDRQIGYPDEDHKLLSAVSVEDSAAARWAMCENGGEVCGDAWAREVDGD